MSDQWTDNPDVASDDAPEVLPESATGESIQAAPADEVATEEPADEAVATDEAAVTDEAARRRGRLHRRGARRRRRGCR